MKRWSDWWVMDEEAYGVLGIVIRLDEDNVAAH